MSEEPESQTFETIRDTPLALCIGHTLLDITADEKEEFVADPKNKNRVYLHFSNGETIFCTIGAEGSEMLGLLGTDDDGEEGDNATT